MRGKLPGFLLSICLFILSCQHVDREANHDSESDEMSSKKKDTSYDTEDVSDAPNGDKRYENLLLFNIKDTLQVHSIYKATLGLAKGETIEELKRDVLQSSTDNGNNIIDTTLKIASVMRATLKESGGTKEYFQISPIGEEEQSIDEVSDNKAFWQWNIEPLKEGKHQLELVVEIVVKSRHIFLPSRTIPVLIYSQPEGTATKVSNFIGNNWQWIISAVFIPLFITWITIRHKNKQAVDAEKIKQKTAKNKNRNTSK